MRRPQRCTEGENPSRTSKLPTGGVVLLVLVGLLAAALIVIYRLSFDKIRTNQTIQTLKEENEALRRNLSAGSPNSTTMFPAVQSERCPTCEAGWEKHGGNCYYFSTKMSSWTDSRRSCIDLGSDLVKIDSREEQMFLLERLRVLMVDDEDMFWLGLTDSVKEGKWFWVDGSAQDKILTFWKDGEPDNKSKDGAASADCARMRKKIEAQGLNSWFDISCNYHQKSICEKTAGLSSCVCV